MRYSELVEAGDNSPGVKQQSMRRANDQLRAADAQGSDAVRKCQERRQKAAQDGDPAAAADALRAFNKARAAADNKSANARAKLTKLRN